MINFQESTQDINPYEFHTLDIYCKVASIETEEKGNKLIISNSGSGKKTLMQGMMKSYVAKGYPVFIMDEEDDYKHISSLLGIDSFSDSYDALEYLKNKVAISGSEKTKKSLRAERIANFMSSERIMCLALQEWIESDEIPQSSNEFREDISELCQGISSIKLKEWIARTQETQKGLGLFPTAFEKGIRWRAGYLRYYAVLILIIKSMYMSKVKRYTIFADVTNYRLQDRGKFFRNLLQTIKKYGGELVMSAQPCCRLEEIERIEREFDKKIEFKMRGEMLISSIDRSSKEPDEKKRQLQQSNNDN